MKSSYSKLCSPTKLAIVDLSQMGPTLWEINRVNVPEQFRRQGIANELMRRVLADADREAATLRLVINAYGDMSWEALLDWYQRLGFVKDNSGFLVREPQPPKVYILSFTNADSYHSHKDYPIPRVFESKEEAERVARDQKGYGLGIDWRVEEFELVKEH